MEDIHVGFYRIQKCGHYKRGEPEVPVFGGLVPMLNQLRTWATHQAQLSLTKTFEQSDDGAHLPLYLVDLSESEGTWLMTLWNEVPWLTTITVAG